MYKPIERERGGDNPGFFEAVKVKGSGRYAAGASKYQQMDIDAKNPIELVVMLYEGAIRFLKGLRKAIEDEDGQQQAIFAKKVSAILEELEASLDEEQGGEVAVNLKRLYNYFQWQLIQAGVKKSVDIVDDLSTQMNDLAGSWRDLAEKSRTMTIDQMLKEEQE